MFEPLRQLHALSVHKDFDNQQMRYIKLYPILAGWGVLLIVLGFFFQAPTDIFRGLLKIATTEAGLLTDYVALAGMGAALVNAGLVTLISLGLLWMCDEPANGMTVVAIGLMSGFALFGKNYLNIWPILFGTYIYSKIQKEKFSKYAILGLSTTALAPVVSFLSINTGFGNVWIGIFVGIIIGIVVPPLSTYTFQIQNGMNLYSTGFACGLIALMVVPLMTSMGAQPQLYEMWATGYNLEFAIIISAICVLLILGGLFGTPLPVWAAWAGYCRLLQTSGRSPNDYLRMFGAAPTAINTGINGLIGLATILMIEGDLNGPTVGAIFTIMGFSAFGKHAKNILPVISGVVLGTLISESTFDESPVQLAVLFCTTLAPISGYFGWFYGVVAGFFHSAVVTVTTMPVSGLNLYNNGFSGGLVAIFLYPIILAVVRHRKAEVQDEDYFDMVEHDEPIVPPVPRDLTEESIKDS